MAYPPIEALELANLVFFGISILPVCYCFYIHGRQGFGPWLNTLVWNALRIAANAVAFKSITTTGIPDILIPLVVNGVGLSPFSLVNFSIRKELPLFAGAWGSIFAQVIIIVGISLALKGLTELILLKAGLIIWLLGWVYTGAMIVGSWSSKCHKNRLPDEKVLLYAATAAWPLVGFRVVYVTYCGYVYHIFDQGGITIVSIFGVLPEFLCMTIYLTSGIWTRNLSRTHKILRQEEKAAKKQAKAAMTVGPGKNDSSGALEKFYSCSGSDDTHKSPTVNISGSTV
ncbi:hypothetical protein N7520_011569 [Penicillium odoratum]|uniref:uncharacterized protein n=1 Tax=Penicillium odoratum TaxID=1167516 RepID=UPI0025483F1F|nr:uncharacterized protein N7520_011569 [Penicillium odoratum]KAJ5746387.1 hypothetical protein N7520_011569 [Penicillium odoratum]